MKRGFEICSQFEQLVIDLPKRATKKSAGYDFTSIEDVIIQPKQTALIKTGIKAYMQRDEVLKLYIRSSMAVKRGLMLTNGVGIIDSDYYNNETNEGHIMISVYNYSDQVVMIERGERVAQGIFEKYLVVDHEAEIQVKRLGGFGSSTKI